MNAIVPRDTVARVVDQRNRALEAYSKAFDCLTSADEAVTAAREAARLCAPRINRFNFYSHETKAKFFKLDVAPRDDFMKVARKIVDTDTWAYLIELTDLESLMDKKAKDQLHQELLTNPPEITEDNIIATMEQFSMDAKMIFQRGVAECFSALDRRFRSHDGWKIGGRVVLSYAFDQWGSWSFSRNHRDTIIDIERAFFVLDGLQPPKAYHGLVEAIDSSRRGGWGARQSEVETEYFKARGFKNGNCHIWFKRDDLLEKVNKTLAEYYGEVIPEDRQPEDDGGLFTPKTTLAKNYGFFPSPDAAAELLLERVPFYREPGEPAPLVLEPSAGRGALAARAVAKGAVVDCVEIQPDMANGLADLRVFRNVHQADFLTLSPETTGLYDIILMNPPFDRERDIDHVVHAMKFLKPKGYLAAIMSAGTEFRETRKSIAFRELMNGLRCHWEDMPARSFASVGTNVNTIILRVFKDGRSFYR